MAYAHIREDGMQRAAPIDVASPDYGNGSHWLRSTCTSDKRAPPCHFEQQSKCSHIVRMSTRTMRAGGIYGERADAILKSVDASRHSPKVLRIHASSIAAHVIDDPCLWDGSFGIFVCEAMCHLIPNAAIAVRREFSLERNAFRLEHRLQRLVAAHREAFFRRAATPAALRRA